MGHTCNQVVINASYDRVFDISNDIPRWTELFGEEYQKAEVLEKKDNKITFRLTDDEGNSWVSYRILNKEYRFAYAQKKEPVFPFKYMKIVWLYTEVPGGILMTWIQHFQMDPNAKYNDQEVEGFVNKHSQDNLLIFKQVIEKEATKG